mmetsp:Transcript_17442/g.16646  ORF Transcript_17442/g.16646 Transcript_17442/m.16646 type:complete len:165 (+) Transcript_17442:465-959(+)
MLVDPKLEDNHLSLKILNLVSSFLQKSPLFCELSYSYAIQDYHKSGLDVLFYGQDHNDTLSILSTHKDRSEEEIISLMSNQQLLSNKELMIRNFNEVIKNLKECESYIQKVVDGDIKGDPEIGRALNDCMSQFSTDDLTVLETLVKSNYEDVIMINTLSKLQYA